MEAVSNSSSRRRRRTRRLAKSEKTKSNPGIPDYRGRRFTPGGNPPDINLIPYNQCTLIHAGSDTKGAYSYNARDLIVELLKQINPDKNGPILDTHLEIKIRNVRAWNVTGNQISLVVFDFVTSPQTTLATMMDYCAKDSYASVGYEFPTTHQQVVLRSSTEKIYDIAVAGNNSVIIYTSLLWKFIGTPKYSFTTEIFIDIMRNVRDHRVQTMRGNVILGEISSKSSKTLDVLKKIEENQPGLLSKIVDNVVHVGSYVVPLGTDENMVKVIESLEQLKVALDVPEIL